jgi:hypothetical protein
MSYIITMANTPPSSSLQDGASIDGATIGDCAIHIGRRLIQFSPVVRTGSVERVGMNQRNAHYPSADAEFEEVLDVEGDVSGLNRSLFPPSERTQSTPKFKGGRTRPSHDERQKVKTSEENDGGSRLILNISKSSSGLANTRTCLLDSVISITPTTKDRSELSAAMSSSMPTEGDTSVKNIGCALKGSRLMLKQVNSRFLKSGGAPYNLFQESNCRIIIRIKLTDRMGLIMWHFVAWDGDVVFDAPYSNKINMRRDRASPVASKLAFGRLYPKTEFKNWQITAVYELIDLEVVNH